MDWILVLCVAFNTQEGHCWQLRQARYPSYELCAAERDAVARQRDVSFAYCRPAREPEIVR